MALLASADRLEPDTTNTNSERLQGKLEKLEGEIKHLKALEEDMLNTPDQQISLTDPDARSMATSGRGSGMVGYNLQSAVDVKHHLIAAHEVTTVGNDRSALYRMSIQAKEVIGADHLEVVADRGYYNGTEIYNCEQAQITTYIPKSQTTRDLAKGLFGKRDFKWIAEEEEYECPAGERLIWRFTTEEKGKHIHKFWTSNCPRCPIKNKCTTSKYRRMTRWEHEDVLDIVQERLDREPERMRARRETVEHPFGTIKSWMGYTHFQMKTLKHVSTEMSLHVLAYNLKRVMQIIGIVPLMDAMRV